MAKKIRFPLEMDHGIQVRTMEELRNHFSLVRVLEYFENGKLLIWLKDRYEMDLANQIEQLQVNEKDLQKKLCNILGVKYNEIDAELMKAEKLFIDYKLDKAFSIFKRLAGKGNGRAMYFLGEYYAQGYGSVKEDTEKRAEWRKKGKNTGDTLALLNFAHTLPNNDPGKKKFFEKVFNNVLKLAENGDIFAQWEVADMYKFGLGIEENEEEEVRWLKESASKGFWKAQCDLGYYYRIGQDKSQEAFTWYIKAAELGVTEAQLAVAELLDIDGDLKKDYTEANRWYRKAADQGDVYAMYHLAINYRLGKGCNVDYKEAFKWYQKAADQGLKWAMCHLANLYCLGQGCNIDYKEAFKWYQKAAGLGVTKALLEMGNLLDWKGDLEKDPTRANQWYRKAAEQGEVEAMCYLADNYCEGNGCSVNYYEAFKWYKKAADQGDYDAMYCLANLYYLGKGCSVNHNEAFRLYKEAAEHGVTWAMYNLGMCYRQGDGCKKDFGKSKEWIKEAAEEGNELAIKKLRELFGIVL